MNLKKLKLAEEAFFRKYPQGFQDPEMAAHTKKHKLDQLFKFAQEAFTPEALKDLDTAIENMNKMVSRSTLVSLFEKPKFHDAVRSMSMEEKTRLVTGLNEFLNGDEEAGFDLMLSVLTTYKLAKWTLMTVFPCYYKPDSNLLFKPTTVKNVIVFFELEDLHYKPRPSYDFFIRYREAINSMKAQVDPSLSPNNPAFSGFLMVAMESA